MCTQGSADSRVATQSFGHITYGFFLSLQDIVRTLAASGTSLHVLHEALPICGLMHRLLASSERPVAFLRRLLKALHVVRSSFLGHKSAAGAHTDRSFNRCFSALHQRHVPCL